jgi:hypothetical protein
MTDEARSWAIFQEQYPQMTKLQRELAKQAWFVQEGWVPFIGYYWAGIYMQVYKAHWYNQSGDGIHFEMGLDDESLTQKRAFIDLHIAHRNLFDRVRFNELTIPHMAEVVATWEGDVTFSKKNLGERLRVMVPFTKSGFAKQITAGFAKVCALGDIIDEGLAQL